MESEPVTVAVICKHLPSFWTELYEKIKGKHLIDYIFSETTSYKFLSATFLKIGLSSESIPGIYSHCWY